MYINEVARHHLSGKYYGARLMNCQFTYIIIESRPIELSQVHEVFPMNSVVNVIISLI